MNMNRKDVRNDIESLKNLNDFGNFRLRMNL